jgi:hypothetical protein
MPFLRVQHIATLNFKNPEENPIFNSRNIYNDYFMNLIKSTKAGKSLGSA